MEFSKKVAVFSDAKTYDLRDLPIEVVSARLTEDYPGSEGSYWEPASAAYRVYRITRIKTDLSGFDDDLKEQIKEIKIGDRVKVEFTFAGDELEMVEVAESAARILGVMWQGDTLNLSLDITGYWQDDFTPQQSEKGRYRATV